MSTDLLLVKTTTANIIGILLVGCTIAVFHIGHCDSATLDLSVSYSRCYGDQYAENSTYQANLNTLLSTMKNSSVSMNFYNGSVGEEGGLDPVYGLYFCTGDLPQSDCGRCILQATSDILQGCKTHKEGIIFYNNCELHYSNQSFFGAMNLESWIKLFSHNEYSVHTTEPMTLMSKLVEEAPFQQPLMFSTSVDQRNNRYGFAQCSSDLSVYTCQNCLSTILGEIASCCTQYVGWRYLTPSCWIRFETNPFLMNINASTQTTVEHVCSNDEFPSGERTKLNANLDHLSSLLLGNGSKTGFYNTSVGTNSTADVLHGLVLCRGDVNSTTCEDCLNMSTKNISQYCPNKTNGILWYENCLLRYSDQDFFGVVDYEGRTYCNQEVATEDADVAIVGLMTRLVKVATNQHPLMYAAGNVSINSNSSIYGQLQCTRDLSSNSCEDCLTFGLTNVSSNCKLRNGWRYLSGSCILRYEDFLFFDPTVASLSSQSDNEGQ